MIPKIVFAVITLPKCCIRTIRDITIVTIKVIKTDCPFSIFAITTANRSKKKSPKY